MGAQNGGQRPGLRRSSAPVKTHTCSETGWGDAIPDRLWDAGRVRETPGPPSDAAGPSAGHLSDLSCSLQSRLKRPYLHCRADAVVLLGLSAPGGGNICQIRHCPLFHGVRASGMRATAGVKQ